MDQQQQQPAPVQTGPANMDTLRCVTTCQKCLCGFHHSISAQLVQCPVCTHVNALSLETTTQPAIRYTTSALNEFINFDCEELVEMLMDVQNTLLLDHQADIIEDCQITGQKYLQMTEEDWRHIFCESNVAGNDPVGQGKATKPTGTPQKGLNNKAAQQLEADQRQVNDLIAWLLATAKSIITNFSVKTVNVPFMGELIEDSLFDDRRYETLLDQGVQIVVDGVWYSNPAGCPPKLHEQVLPTHYLNPGGGMGVPGSAKPDRPDPKDGPSYQQLIIKRVMQDELDQQRQRMVNERCGIVGKAAQAEGNVNGLPLYPYRFEPQYQPPQAMQQQVSEPM